jgi:hypothetical protein
VAGPVVAHQPGDSDFEGAALVLGSDFCGASGPNRLLCVSAYYLLLRETGCNDVFCLSLVIKCCCSLEEGV